MSTTATHPRHAPGLPEHKRQEARARADSHRAALRRRTRRIRRTIAAGALVSFLAAFAGIYAQLAAGHDPGLAASAKRRSAGALVASTATTRKTSAASGSAKGSTARAASSGQAATSSGGGESASASGGSSGTSSGTEASGSTGSVTTSQS